MRRLLVLVSLLVLFLGNLPAPAVAQSASDTSRASPGGRFVWGFRGGLVKLRGPFRKTVGPSHGGFQGFVALRSSSGFAVGIQLAGSQLQKRTETANLDSGLNVNLKTTTSLTRLGIYGQYGPRFGPVRPYAEGLLGIHIATTNTKIPDNSNQTDDTKTHEESAAPAAGLAVGLEIEAWNFGRRSIALRLEGRHTYGGTVDYLYYSADAGEFVKRSSGSTTSEVNVGLTFNY